MGRNTSKRLALSPERADTFCLDLRADYVLANGSMSSNQSGEGDIRRALIEADREMRNDELRATNRALPTSTFELHASNFASAPPGQLFYSTQSRVRLWFLAKNKNATARRGFLCNPQPMALAP